DKVYAFLRYTENKRVLVLVNFNRNEASLNVKFPKDVLEAFNLDAKAIAFTDLLSDTKFNTANMNEGLSIKMPSTSAVILEF
ncbi:MAG: alpha-amylase, partial [Flavobacterium sp.]